MLQISYIRENKDLVINGLKKRNFKELELVEEAISLDENRRLVQTKLDNALAESNKLSKEIGTLMREGKKQEAEQAKAQTSKNKSNNTVLLLRKQSIRLMISSIVSLISPMHLSLKEKQQRTTSLCSKQARFLTSLRVPSLTGNWLRNTISLTSN